MEILVTEVVFGPLLVLSLWTIFVCFFTVKKIADKRLKIMFSLLCGSVFVYSGYGIAFPEVDDRYIVPYMIFVSSFSIPFLCLKNNKLGGCLQDRSSVDSFFETHITFLKYCTFIYLLCRFIPLVYPEFKLFQIFQTGFSGLVGFYDLRVQYKSNALIGLIDTIRVFSTPFFFIYLTVIRECR